MYRAQTNLRVDEHRKCILPAKENKVLFFKVLKIKKFHWEKYYERITFIRLFFFSPHFLVHLPTKNSKFKRLVGAQLIWEYEDTLMRKFLHLIKFTIFR